MKTKENIFLLLFFLVFFSLKAQDLTGKWVAVTPLNEEYYAELNLIHNQDNLYGGHSYDTEKDGFCRHWLDAKFDKETKIFSGKDVELIEKSPNHEATDYYLKYEKGANGEEYLVGTQTIAPLDFSNEGQSLLQQMQGLIYTRRVPQQIKYVKKSATYTPFSGGVPDDFFAQTEEVEIPEETEEPKVEEPVEPLVKEAPEEVEEKAIVTKKNARSNRLLADIKLNQVKEVTLLVRDYGKIDNDTISIFFNNELIASDMRIESKAKEFKLKLKEKGANELVFVANNLGEVPPNTCRISIIAEDKRYNYRLFTDEENNALIKLENNVVIKH